MRFILIYLIIILTNRIYDIPSDEEVVFKKFSGYNQVANYEEL